MVSYSTPMDPRQSTMAAGMFLSPPPRERMSCTQQRRRGRGLDFARVPAQQNPIDCSVPSSCSCFLGLPIQPPIPICPAPPFCKGRREQTPGLSPVDDIQCQLCFRLCCNIPDIVVSSSARRRLFLFSLGVPQVPTESSPVIKLSALNNPPPTQAVSFVPFRFE